MKITNYYNKATFRFNFYFYAKKRLLNEKNNFEIILRLYQIFFLFCAFWFEFAFWQPKIFQARAVSRRNKKVNLIKMHVKHIMICYFHNLPLRRVKTHLLNILQYIDSIYISHKNKNSIFRPFLFISLSP